LQAVVGAVNRTTRFDSAMLLAANLGDDADITRRLPAN
jgi:ADP-ribosylglycohydrolase